MKKNKQKGVTILLVSVLVGVVIVFLPYLYSPIKSAGKDYYRRVNCILSGGDVEYDIWGHFRCYKPVDEINP